MKWCTHTNDIILYFRNIKNFTFAFNQYHFVRHPALSLNISNWKADNIFQKCIQSAYKGRKAFAASNLKPWQDILNRCTKTQLLSFLLFPLPSVDAPSLHNSPLFPVTEADVRKPTNRLNEFQSCWDLVVFQTLLFSSLLIFLYLYLSIFLILVCQQLFPSS